MLTVAPGYARKVMKMWQAAGTPFMQLLPVKAKNGRVSLAGFWVDKKDVQLAAAFVSLSLMISMYCFTSVMPPAPYSLYSSDSVGTPSPEAEAEARASHAPVEWDRNQLLAQLKEMGLWEVAGDEKIPPALFANFPADINQLDVSVKKKAFLHTLLPVALVALEEVKRERITLLAILDKLGGIDEGVSFRAGEKGWQDALSDAEAAFILGLVKKYRTAKPSELVTRVNVLPVSLILAQGALESSWGGSRFSRLGNNLFGMWTWGEKGIVPSRREAGKTHKLAIYDSLLEAVRHYILTINRVSAYENLWMIRAQTMDSSAIAEGLNYYSERGSDYVEDIKNVIERNRLTLYDNCRLQQFGFLAYPNIS